MAKVPQARYFQYCPEKLLGEVDLLDETEELIYRRLLDYILKSGDRLPDNDSKICNLVKVRPVRWRKVKNVLIEQNLIFIEDGRITNVTCQESIARVTASIQQKAAAGRASVDARRSAAQAPAAIQPEIHGEKRPEKRYEFDSIFDPEFGSFLEANPLENNETPSTDVGLPVGTAVGTNSKELIREDNNNACEGVVPKLVSVSKGTSQAPPIGQLDAYRKPLAKPPSVSPSVVALISAFTAAVIREWGVEVGGAARQFPNMMDALVTERWLTEGQNMGLDETICVDLLKEHFARRLAGMHNDGGRAPTTMKVFDQSAPGCLQKYAREVIRPKSELTMANGSGGGYRNGHGRSNESRGLVVQQPWESFSNKLAKQGKFTDAKRINHVAATDGFEAANALVHEMEARGKQAAA